MKDRNRKGLTPAERRAQEALRGLGRPRADSAFRERLKAEFASGALANREPRLRERRPPSLPLRLGLVALAASVLLLVVVLSENPMPGPVAVSTSGEGYVTVDGVRVAADRMDEISRLLAPGATVTLEDGAELDIDYPGTMSWRLHPGTTVELPDAPGRWFGRAVSSRLTTGEVSVMTREDFPGARLTVATEEGRVAVSGTLVSVVRNGALTCVCVQEGTARMEAGGVDLGLIQPGRRWVIFRDGRAPLDTEMAPPHREHLLEFRRDRLWR